MKDLFTMDRKNYDASWKVFRRPSVRAIIIREDKVLMIHSKKYDYYKFPGGGLDKGESHIQALIREVKEESGYQVIPESIKEYGRVLRRRKDDLAEDTIFEQENFYYLCEVGNEVSEVHLDDYEAEEGFTPVWIEPLEASYVDFNNRKKYIDPEMVERESKVLSIVDQELRKILREQKEKAWIKELGDIDYADMLDFVKKTLDTKTEGNGSFKLEISYSRFDHTKRVLGWAKKLYDASTDKENLCYEDLMIAAIFHDVGRAIADDTHVPHAQAGGPITEEYLLKHGFSAEKAAYIRGLVEGHSDKYLMKDPAVDRNLLLLMEADLLDDMGAMGILMDTMITMSRNPQAQFTDCLDHIARFTQRQQKDNPLTSEAGRRFWDEKTALVDRYVEALKADVELF